MKHRAKPTESGWKIERLEPTCPKCGDGGEWKTILHAYYPMAREEQERLCLTIADLLNSKEETP